MGNNNNPRTRQSKGKTRWNNKESRDRRVASSKETEKSGKANDYSWYVLNEQMVKDVGSLSFNNALGTPVRLNSDSSIVSGFNYGAVPGIFTIYTVPSVGYAGTEVDGVNIASKNLYSWVRHANSGHSNYDSPDLMLYYIAMDSVYAYLAYLTRIYGTARVFSQTNRYLGATMLSAMGVDATDIYANLSDLRSYINIYITKAGSMCVPATMSYFIRHLWQYSFIYKDEDISKSSFYMYNPAYLWVLNTTGTTSLDPFPVSCEFNSTNGIVPVSTKLTVNDLTLKAEQLLNPIIASEDFNIMSGDTLKAFGKESLFSMPLVGEDYACIPIYSDEVLYQIHNTQFAGSKPMDINNTLSLDSLKIIQDTSIGSGNLLFQPKFLESRQLIMDRVIDFYKQEVDPKDVIVASRNLLAGDVAAMDSSGAYLGTAITSCGSEICIFAVVSKYLANGRLEEKTFFTTTPASGYIAPMYVGKFNFAPLYVFFSGNGVPMGIQGDLGNYTVLSNDEVKKLHDTAILSMFGVNQLGNANTK